MTKIKKIKLTRYYNKSRKGLYYYSRYVDERGETRTSILKYRDGMTLNDVEKHIQELSERRKGSKRNKKVYLKTTKRIKARKKRKKLEQVEISREKFERDERYYERSKERSWNTLVKDRFHEQTERQYRMAENRIIMALKNKHGGMTLKNMGEEDFQRRLEDYLGGADYRGAGWKDENMRMFISDIVNKWGSEIKVHE